MKNKPSLLDIESFNKKREREMEQEPSVLEEDSKVQAATEPSQSHAELLKLIQSQKNEINKISYDLTRVTEQLKAHKVILEKQEQEIALLKEQKVIPEVKEVESKNVRQADIRQNKELILKNIINLIEEEGFSYNDVARLFKLEGFLPPSPYENWDDKVVEKMYIAAK